MRAAVGQSETTSNVTPQVNLSSRAIALMILGVTFLTYAGTLRYEFVYDDRGQIVDNPLIKSWYYLPRYFSDHVWAYVDPSMLGNYYRPLFLVWLFINHTLFGLNPVWWHFTTILAHLGVTYMVFTLAQRLLKNTTAAAIAALVFGLHPTHIESVAWISGITDPMLGLFFIPSFLFYWRWREASSNQNGESAKVSGYRKPAFNLVVSLFFFVLAMLSKETALVLPALVFGTEWIYSEGPLLRRLLMAARPAVLYAMLAVPYLIVRSLVLKGLGHSLSQVSPLTTAKTVPSALWFYITHLIWPFNLSCFYDLSFVTRIMLTNFWQPLAGVLAVGAGLWLIARRLQSEMRKAMAVACLWLALPILPVLNMSVFAGGELVHDRYLYLPSIGLALLVGMGLSRLKITHAQLFGQPALRLTVTLLLALGLGLATASQHEYWASELLLFQHGLTISPDSRIAKTGLANVLSDRGYADAAIDMYNEVLDRYPTNWKTINNLACTYIKKGSFNEAEATLMRGIDVRPNEPKQYITLSVTLQELNRLAEAEQAANYAISLNAKGYGFHYQLGDILEEQGRLAEALDAYHQEAANHPDFVQAAEKVANLQTRMATPSNSAPVKP